MLAASTRPMLSRSICPAQRQRGRDPGMTFHNPTAFDPSQPGCTRMGAHCNTQRGDITTTPTRSKEANVQLS